MRLILIVLVIAIQAQAKNFLQENLKTFKWNDVEVVWLENNNLPLFEMSVYFADGALAEDKKEAGLTQMMFDQLSSGTLQYTQKEIADIFEFYGSGISSRVTHEYSFVKISGMAKDAVPTVKMMCHLFSKATFPKKPLSSYKLRLKTNFKNLVNSKSDLADRVFRQISLKGSQYVNSVDGNLKSIKTLTNKNLKSRLSFMNEKVTKKIYITGPASIKQLESVIQNDCRWSGKSKYTRKAKKISIIKKNKPVIHFLALKDANQAQIRIGDLIRPTNKKNERELLGFATTLLGGGFTSKLMQELRVKRGLTYSVSSYAAFQRDYGRGVISTFTKNESLTESLEVIKNTLNEVAQGKIDDKELKLKKQFSTGQYLFSFEDTSSILSQLMQLDHIGRNYNTIYEYPQIVEGISKKDVAEMIKRIFEWNQQSIVVIGAPGLEKQLKKIGNVQKVNLKDFL